MDTKEWEAPITGGAAGFEAARAERKSAAISIEVLRGEARKLSDEIPMRGHGERRREEAGAGKKQASGRRGRRIQAIRGVLSVRRDILKARREGTEGAGRRKWEMPPLSGYLRTA